MTKNGNETTLDDATVTARCSVGGAEFPLADLWLDNDSGEWTCDACSGAYVKLPVGASSCFNNSSPIRL